MQMPKSLSFGGSALQDVRDFDPIAIGDVINRNNAILEGMYRAIYNDTALAKVAARQIADDAINEDAIVDGSVTAPKTALTAINDSTGNLNVLTVDEAQLIASAVTAAKTSLAAINATTGNLNILTVDEAQLIANAVTAGKTSLAAINSSTGAVNTDHVVAAMINVAGLDGTTGRIAVVDQTDADIVTGGINTYAATLIQPGKILISGAVTLDGWSHASDATLIDGGNIYTDSITATQMAANSVTASELNVVGIDGTTGRIVVADATDANAVTVGINTHAATLIQAGKIVISGAVNLDDWSHPSGATKINGGEIYTDSIVTDSLSANLITVTELRQTGGSEAVSTVCIRDNAVTEVVSSFTAATQAVDTSLTTVQSAAINSDGKPMIVQFTTVVNNTHGALQHINQMYLYRDKPAGTSPNVLVNSSIVVANMGVQVGATIALSIEDTPPNEDGITYYMQLKSTNIAVDALHRSLILTRLKK